MSRFRTGYTDDFFNFTEYCRIGKHAVTRWSWKEHISAKDLKQTEQTAEMIKIADGLYRKLVANEKHAKGEQDNRIMPSKIIIPEAYEPYTIWSKEINCENIGDKDIYDPSKIVSTICRGQRYYMLNKSILDPPLVNNQLITYSMKNKLMLSKNRLDWIELIVYIDEGYPFVPDDCEYRFSGRREESWYMTWLATNGHFGHKYAHNMSKGNMDASADKSRSVYEVSYRPTNKIIIYSLIVLILFILVLVSASMVTLISVTYASSVTNTILGL